MKTAIIYQYWTRTPGNVWESQNLPIIQSIACLRQWRQDKVYVLDVSDHTENVWGEFPEMLNFEVVKRDLHMKGYIHDYQKYDWASPHMLSKPGDIYNFSLQIPEESIIFIDLDIFYIRPPLEFDVTPEHKLAISSNTGLWKINKTWAMAEHVIDLWQSFCVGCMYDLRLFNNIKKVADQYFIHDEAVYRYLNTIYPQYFSETPRYENCIFGHIGAGEADPKQVVGLHVQNSGFYVEMGKRSAVCFYIKEINDIMKKTFSKEQLGRFYGSDRRIEPVTLNDVETMKKWNSEC